MVGHPGSMGSPETSTFRQWGPHVRLFTLILAMSVAMAIGTGGLSAQAQGAHKARLDLSSTQHKPQTKHQKSKTQQSGSHPCLEGNWNVTSLTLSTTGLTFTGGAGTTVDIKSNGDALGNFTRGAPLTGSEGSAKIQRDHYRPLRLFTQGHVALGYVPSNAGNQYGDHHRGRCYQARNVLRRTGLLRL